MTEVHVVLATGLLLLWVCNFGSWACSCCWQMWGRVSATHSVPCHLCTDNICHVYYEHASTCSHTSVCF